MPLYDKFYDHFVQKVYDGEEVEKDNEEKFIQWIENRLKPNLFFLDKEDYLESCIDSLKTVYDVAGTDYGSSRQRDKAQLWSDMTRGYLGEIAVRKKFVNDFNIQAKLAHQPGKLADFTGSDLPFVKKVGDKNFRDAKINISIKTTKWNGIWMDVPGSQYDHSDYFVLTKINTGTDHLMAFLKEMGFFETVMKKGIEKKNIQDIVGHPLLAYTICSSLRCDFIHKTVVSSENQGDASTYLQTASVYAYGDSKCFVWSVLGRLQENGFFRNF